MVDRVRKTITAGVNLGNQNDNDTSQVDLNVSQFSNVLPHSMMLDQNNLQNQPMTPTGQNRMNMLNFGFNNEEYQEVRDTSIIDGAAMNENGDKIMESFDAGNEAQNNMMAFNQPPGESEYVQDDREKSLLQIDTSNLGDYSTNEQPLPLISDRTEKTFNVVDAGVPTPRSQSQIEQNNLSRMEQNQSQIEEQNQDQAQPEESFEQIQENSAANMSMTLGQPNQNAA